MMIKNDDDNDDEFNSLCIHGQSVMVSINLNQFKYFHDISCQSKIKFKTFMFLKLLLYKIIFLR